MADISTTVDRSATAPPGGAATLSGLSDGQAREFHRMFVISFLLFLGIAIVAHILVWQWRPWIPGAPGYQVGAPGVTGSIQAPAALVG